MVIRTLVSVDPTESSIDHINGVLGVGCDVDENNQGGEGGDGGEHGEEVEEDEPGEAEDGAEEAEEGDEGDGGAEEEDGPVEEVEAGGLGLVEGEVEA